jgi:hypothetical protein
MKGVRIASIAATLWGLLRPVGYDWLQRYLWKNSFN